MTLNALAAAAMKKSGGDAGKAVTDFLRYVNAANLLDELALAFLKQFAVSPSGHPHGDTASARVPPIKTPESGSVRVSKHPVREHRRRTPAEKQAARAAAAASVEAVFELEINGRPVGNIRMGELSTLRHELVDDASGKLMLGIDAARNAVLAELIRKSRDSARPA